VVAIGFFIVAFVFLARDYAGRERAGRG
jgi:hypothetical protein